MRTITRLNPPIWLYTPKGAARAHFLICESVDDNLEWVCQVPAQDNICFTFDNSDVRFQENYTLGIQKPSLAHINNNERVDDLALLRQAMDTESKT